MTLPLTPADREKEPASLLNAIFIGYMVGTYSVIGKGGAQAIANMAGEYVGRELVAFAKSQDAKIDSPRALAEFLEANQLVGAITIGETADNVTVQIAQCGICPKRIGKYKFDGTACPWGGILIGALGNILEREFTVSPSLTPAEKCAITLKPRKTR
jgi:predicted hydrocarbon binding protein